MYDQKEGILVKTVIIDVVVGEKLIDSYGHINYKKYPDLFRKGQDAFVKRLGISFNVLNEKYGIRSVVRSIRIEYLSEIRLTDSIRIKTTISSVGISSFVYEQEIKKGGIIVTTCRLVVVMIDSNGEKKQIPPDIRQKLNS